MYERTLKNVLKYACMALVLIMLFTVLNNVACTIRGCSAIGGEIVVLFLPAVWWIIKRG
jgi:hypothetical protein